jgi:hypothetical protein
MLFRIIKQIIKDNPNLAKTIKHIIRKKQITTFTNKV